MSAMTTPRVPISKIDVKEGFNPRTHMDERKLEGLALSFKTSGVVQPLSVRPAKGGRFVLVGGHRRLEAAKRAGIKDVPITVGEGNACLDALIENLHREDLDPIDTARGLEMLKGELNLTTNKQIADKTGLDATWIGLHLRLLKLPEGVQRHIAEGAVPIEAERLLRDIVSVSPRVAECICEYAKRKKLKARRFIDRFDEVFAATAEAKFTDKPTMISVGRGRVSDVAKGKKRAELAERINALDAYYRPEDPTIPFDEAEIDAARAAGCLVEHHAERNGFRFATAFIIDAELAADLAEQAVQRVEEAAAARAEAKAKKARSGREDSGTDPEKEARAAKREEAKKEKAKAEVFNEDAERNLLRGRTAARRKRHGLARAKAIARLVIAYNPQLAGAGLRLVAPQLRDIEVKELKSGKKRSKVVYAEEEQCMAELLRRVDSATSEAEVIEVLTEAIVAALVVDESQLPRSRRIHWFPRAEEEITKLLGPDIKAMRPRRTQRSRRPEGSAGRDSFRRVSSRPLVGFCLESPPARSLADLPPAGCAVLLRPALSGP